MVLSIPNTLKPSKENTQYLKIFDWQANARYHPLKRTLVQITTTLFTAKITYKISQQILWGKPCIKRRKKILEKKKTSGRICFPGQDLEYWTATGQVLDSWTATGQDSDFL